MKSIRQRLWVWMMAFAALLLILLWLFQIVFLENFYTGIQLTQLTKHGREIAQHISLGNQEEAQRISELLSYENNAGILLLDQNATILYQSSIQDSPMQMPMMRNSATAQLIDRVLKGEEVTVELTHPRFGNTIQFIGLPMWGDAGVEKALIISAPLAPIRDTVAILKRQLGIITIVLLFVTVFFATYLSHIFSKPIRIITKTAEQIAAGNYDARIALKAKDEIGQLTDTINHMAQSLSRVEALRKDLIANVSHELRTPLTLIRSYAETTLDVSGENKEKRDKNLTVIIEETVRLGKMVDNMLHLSLLQSGSTNIFPSQFELAQFLKDIVAKYEHIAASNGLKIQLQGLEVVVVKADKEQIERVLYNLIGNAIAHTKRGGSITIQMEHIDKEVTVSVADTGSGIAKEELAHIWDRFYKGSSGKGTGLGLAIVKSILEAHGWRYGMQSELGVGTTVWFRMHEA